MKTLLKLLIIGLLTHCAFAQPRPELVLQLGHSARVNQLAWGPSGLLLSGSEDGTARIWDADHLLATLAPHQELPAIIWAGWVSPEAVVCASHPGKFRVYDWKSRALLREFGNDQAQSVAGNGPRVALSTLEAVEVYDCTTGQRVFQHKPAGEFAPGNLALSPDGRFLAVVTFYGRGGVSKWQLDFISLDDGRVRGFPLQSNCDYLVFSPDSQRLAAADWAQVTLYDRQTGPLRTFSAGMMLNGLDWKRSDRLVGSCSNVDQPPWIAWNPSTGQTAETGRGGHADAVAANPDGLTLARAWNDTLSLENWQSQPLRSLGQRCSRPLTLNLASGQLLVGLNNGQLLGWALGDGRLQTRLSAQQSYINDAAISPDQRLVATCDAYYQHLRVREFPGGKPVFEVRAARPRSVSFNPDGSLLALTGDGQIELYQTGDWKLRSRLALTSECRALAWSQTMLSAICTQEVADYDTTSGKRLRTWQARGLNGRPLSLTCGLYLPGGDLWVGSQASTMAVMPQGASTPVVLQASNTTSMRSLAASADGKLVVSTGDYGVIDLWDTQRRRLLPAHPETHGVDHGAVLILPDGKTLAAIGDDYRVRFWDLASGREKGQLVVMDSGQNWVAAASDGRFDGTPEGQRSLEWRVGKELFRLDQFFEQFFKPGLLKDLASEGKTPQASLSAQPKPPLLGLLSPAPGSELTLAQTDVVVKVTERGSGSSRLRLYANGHPVGEGQRTGDLITFQAPLSPGTNELRVTGFDASGQVESRGDWMRVVCKLPNARKPRLHVLACGIDRYPDRPLKYARADAQAFVAPFSAPGLFEGVQPVLLLDEQASRASVLAALARLAQESQPQDTLVVYLSGHGTLLGESYHYRCADGQDLTSSELALALEAIPAARQLLVLDTCHSGAAGSDLAARFIRGQQRLARGSGTFLLAASRSGEAALEVPGVRHGLLTFAVLRGMSPAGAPVNAHKQLTANGLVQFASFDVEELARKFKTEQEVVQYSTGRDFPLLQR